MLVYASSTNVPFTTDYKLPNLICAKKVKALCDEIKTENSIKSFDLSTKLMGAYIPFEKTLDKLKNEFGSTSEDMYMTCQIVIDAHTLGSKSVTNACVRRMERGEDYNEYTSCKNM